MGEHKVRMLRGERYRDNDPELLAERRRAQSLLDRFNAATGEQDAERQTVLGELLGGIGTGSWIMPRFQCDYGYLIRLGDNSFLNYDAILMDCAPITIGDDVSIGPRAQLLTARTRWPITPPGASVGRPRRRSPSATTPGWAAE